MVFGPAPPKGSTKVNGRTVVPKKFQGPVRPGTDVDVFRRTGRSVPISEGTGEGMSAADFESAKRAEETRRIAAEKARKESQKRIDEQKKQEQKKLGAEIRRIGNLKEQLRRQNAQGRVIKLRDSRTGDMIQQEILINNKTNEKVLTTTNLRTGDKKTRSFQRASSGRIVESGGLTTSGKVSKKKEATVDIPKNFLKQSSVNLPKDVKIMLENDKLSTSINQIRNTQQLNFSIQNDVQKGMISQFLLDVADVISGGSITESAINKAQTSLNVRIYNFNKKYNGQELGANEFSKAESEQKFIESEQSKINNRLDSLVSSKANKVRNFYQSLSIQKTPRLTIAQQNEVIRARNNNIKIQNQIKKNQPEINRKNQQIRTLTVSISKLGGATKRTSLDEIKLFRLKNQIGRLENEIAVLEFRRPPRIIMGTMPIIPATAIPSGISQVSFIGTQKAGKGGKIITNIVFKTNKGTMGIAKGVSLTKKGQTVSIVGGRFGKVTARLLKGGRKFRKIKSFAGLEKGKAKSVKFTSDKLRQISKFIQEKNKTGLIRVIKTNIKGLQQTGVGRVATIKGRTFFKPFIRFPSGKLGTKLGKGMDLDDFASVSAILTKGDLSAIMGKTITLKGRKAEFIGLIKSLSGGSSRVVLSGSGKQQYSRALQKLFTSVSAAVSKAERSGRYATKGLVLSAAASMLSKTVPTVSKIKSARTTLVKREITSPKLTKVTKEIRATTTKQMRRSLVMKKTKAKQLTKQKSKQLTKQKSRQLSRQGQKQISRVKQKQRQGQKQLTLTKQKQQLKTKQLLRSVTVVPSVIPGRGLFPIPFFIPKGFRKKKITKKQPVYSVVMKRRGKLIKLSAKPLVLRDAKDYLAYRLDNGLGRSAWFEPLGLTRDVVGLPNYMRGYFSKVRNKLRPFKIRQGRKRAIRNGYIERKKFVGDTTREVRQLQASRRKSVVRKKKINSPVRRTTNKLIKKRVVKNKRTKVISKKSKSQKKKQPKKRMAPQKRKPTKKTQKKKPVRRRKKRAPTFPGF